MHFIFICTVYYANFHGSRYRYTEDLLASERLSCCLPPGESPPCFHATAGPIQGFLPLSEWEPFLATMPDSVFADYVRRGITHGFRIGYDRSKGSLSRCKSNLKSVHANHEAVCKYISAEVAEGKLKPTSKLTPHCSPIGLIPKPHQPGKFRLIVDLSAPRDRSVNDGIPADLCSLQYATVEHAAGLVQACGRGALMAKLDLKSAYRKIPVHPNDQMLLGIEWAGVTYIDKALPFGLRSAPKIFSAIADALTWAMIQAGVHTVIHYLDDFFFCSSADSEECARSLSIATSLCERLNVPVAPKKVYGPATTLCFLKGCIEIDSRAQELRLPQEKLHRLKELLGQWSGRKVATKQQLQCLLGHLGHAARVVRPGRTFLRELIRTMSRPKHSYHKVRLNVQCKADNQWWNMFCHRWNGISFFQCNPPAPALEMFSDASGSWGCGAFVKGP